jgi:hypothetical protein
VDDTFCPTLKIGVPLSFKMTLEKLTLLKQCPVSVNVTSRRPTLSTKVSILFKMTLSIPTLFKKSAVSFFVTSTTPTLIVLKPVSIG